MSNVGNIEGMDSSRSPTRRHASPIDNFSSDDNTTSSLYEDSSAKGEHPPKESASYSTAVTKSENRAVTLSKLLVFLVLLIAVSAASSITYVRLNEEEQSSFEEMVEDVGSELTSAARQKADHIFNGLDTFSVVLASEAAKEANSTWPFMTASDFSLKAERIEKPFGVDKPSFVMAPIVEKDQRSRWDEYQVENTPLWYQESLKNEQSNFTLQELVAISPPFMYYFDSASNFQVTASAPGRALPSWQYYPLEPTAFGPMFTGYDLLTAPRIADLFSIISSTFRPVIGFAQQADSEGSFFVKGQVLQPIFKGVDTDGDKKSLVAVLRLEFSWVEFFSNLLVHSGDEIFVLVLQSSCPAVDATSNTSSTTSDELGVLSYRVNGIRADFLGEIDAHDPKYDYLEVTKVLVDLGIDPAEVPEGRCAPRLTMHLYPTEKIESTFRSSKPLYYALAVAAVFGFTILVFLIYDYFVGRRQRKIMKRVFQQDKIVSSFFPTAIRDRLVAQNRKGLKMSQRGSHMDPFGFLDSSSNGTGAPLADLFPNTTVVFADIAGFTAWSSAREPQQVFVLLESIYMAFDKIAYRHSIFKVETVGDCYVAVAGLPEPNDDHAVAVANFARGCVQTMREMTISLEVTLGPDTADLALRVGMHSGQVTAGVLRGERSRFQLFGDTMNTASRMESSGERNRIHISQVTADLLVEAGMSKLIKPRHEKVMIKGKGEVRTFWLRTISSENKERTRSSTIKTNYFSSVEESDEISSQSTAASEEDTNERVGVVGMTKTERLVEWNVDVLSTLLQQIIASRGGVVNCIKNISLTSRYKPDATTVLEEFVPIIPLKRFDETELSKRPISPSSIDIGEEAKSQLRNYVSSVASMYNQENPFHNFEHASHVTASVKKLLTRIVNVGDGPTTTTTTTSGGGGGVKNLVDLAGHSYGITSDPLTQFSVVFSALIHDLDHPGVPNAQLVKENTRNAQIYKKSIAEQNSVDLAWEMLMNDDFEALRACIYQTEEDLKRFRQLVVNTVMATDIVDKELQSLRKARWETAFATENHHTDSSEDSAESEDRKATIVIEHLIQASDVSHTMQHWHIYKTWNKKFFLECYGAYKAGRAPTDPSVNWYESELGFFDFYVIPLARKLGNCGVFGVASHEYLNYAMANRAEWDRKGESLVEEYLMTSDHHSNHQP